MDGKGLRGGVLGYSSNVPPAIMKEILADFRADEFEQETEVAPQRIVTQNRVVLLRQVEQAERDERHRHDDPEPRNVLRRGKQSTDGEQHDCAPHRQITSRKHGDSSAVRIVAEGSSTLSAPTESAARGTNTCLLW